VGRRDRAAGPQGAGWRVGRSPLGAGEAKDRGSPGEVVATPLLIERVAERFARMNQEYPAHGPSGQRSLAVTLMLAPP